MRTILLLLTITLGIPSCNKQKKIKNLDMNPTRGLTATISEFNDLEQKFVKEVIENMERGDYFKDKITSVELKNKISNETEYYKPNVVVFFFNPHVIDHVGWISGMERFCFYQVGINWKQRKHQGFKNILTDKKFLMELDEGYYQNPEKSYYFTKSLAEQEQIFKKVNKAFIQGKMMPNSIQGTDTALLEDFNYLSSKNLYELAKDYFVVIKSVKDEYNSYMKDIYVVTISTGENPYLMNTDKKLRLLYPKKGIIIKINLVTEEILGLAYDYATPPLPI